MLDNSCGDGIVLVDKIEGETSFDVVRKAKRLLKKKKVGHAGTLDPFATGLLIILLGQGTKLSSFLMAGRKRYLATMTLGIETDTLDKTGRIVKSMPVPDIDGGKIRDVIQRFAGEIEQTPPAYSAVNYKGQRAYKLARQGISVDLKKRTVTISSIDIISVNLPEITLEVVCSGGTYIRSLAADIGSALGSAAHLSSLRRLSSGIFEVRNAVDSNAIGACEYADNVIAGIISLKDALSGMKECCVDCDTAKKIMNGYRPSWQEIAYGGQLPDEYNGYIKLTNGSSLAAVMEVDRSLHDGTEWLKNIRVFNQYI
jgi:tRNA pseudouridine55 synthase